MSTKDGGFWKQTPVAYEAAVKMADAGLSASQIAEVLSTRFERSITRNAIIGIFHRKNVPLGVQPASGDLPGKEKKPRAKKPPIGVNMAQRITARRQEQITHQQSLPPEIVSHALPVMIESLNPERNVTLADLEDGMCRWMVTDTLYCGCPVVARRKSYCSIHMHNSSMKGYEFNYTKPARRRGRWS